MFNRKTQFLQITAELFNALVIPLYSVCRKLAEFVRDSFCFRDLTGSHARPLLVEDVLQLHRKDLSVLIELLGADVRNRVTGEQR